MRKQAIPPAVLEQHLGIFGKTGRGKTTTGKDCVEQVYDEDYRVCVLDPIKSDWWGLTSSADGTRAGLPFYILGGPHAHLPLTSSSGKAIADLVARGQLRHTIIDMAEFEPGGQLRWFVDFAPRLLQKMKGVLYLVIEEAHLFAPKERAGMGHENMAIHWAKMLATAGRTKGIRLIVLSQRTQSLHNAVIGSCDSMIVHGFTAPADMDPLIKWIKANTKDKALVATIEGSLSGLKTGTGWLCSSEAGIFELREFPKARTYDNTVTPEDDSELAAVKMAPVDLDALRAILGKAAAEAEASDPALLRKRVAELEALLAREKKVVPITAEEIDGHRRQGIEIGYKAGFEAAKGEAEKVVASVAGEARHHAERVIEALKFREVIVSTRNVTPVELPVFQRVPGNKLLNKEERERLFSKVADNINQDLAGVFAGPRSRLSKGSLETIEIEVPDDGVALTSRAHPYGGLKGKILGALVWLESLGMSPAPRNVVAAVAGAKVSGGYFKNTMGGLVTEGLIRGAGAGQVEITDEGRKVAPPPPAYHSVQEAWRAITGGLERQILDVLIEHHPQPMTRARIAEITGKAADAGYFKNTLGRLSGIGAVVSHGGTVALTRYVMP